MQLLTCDVNADCCPIPRTSRRLCRSFAWLFLLHFLAAGCSGGGLEDDGPGTAHTSTPTGESDTPTPVTTPTDESDTPTPVTTPTGESDTPTPVTTPTDESDTPTPVTTPTDESDTPTPVTTPTLIPSTPTAGPSTPTAEPATFTPVPSDVDDDGYTEDGGDCDDHDPTTHPSATEVPYDGLDQDCSGSDLTDVDGDGYPGVAAGGSDCEDQDAAAYPGALEEPYDGVDQDCSGGDLTDVDGDGYEGDASGGDDCDDTSVNTYPGALEYADGADNDCDGTSDEGLDTTDDDGDGISEVAGDCDDGNASVQPGATEVPYDGIDQDCSGSDLADVDGDGYVGAEAGGPDCDDGEVRVNPGQAEGCDGVDNDCDGQTDEGTGRSFYLDADDDGFGDGGQSLEACSAPEHYVENSADCDDKAASSSPVGAEVCDGADNDCDGLVDEDVKTAFYADADEDGFGDASQTTQDCAAPEGYVNDGTDCDDSEPRANPDSVEACDEIDNDCDQLIDEDGELVSYADVDGDTYGNAEVSTRGCDVPDGYVLDSSDCDDGESAANPGQVEVCDGIDNDCDGQTDEDVKSLYYADGDGDGYGDVASSTLACTAPDQYVADNTDCDDGNADSNPGLEEICDEIDNDCDGQVDDGVKITYFQDSDKDGYGNGGVSTQACAAPAGYVEDSSDCDDTTASRNPGKAEVCDGLDNDCDGSIDEGATSTYYQDSDKDGYGNGSVSIQACAAPVGYVENSSDCDDTTASRNPGKAETCDGLDNDCDGSIDEGVSKTYYQDSDKDGYGNGSVSIQACSVPVGYVENSTDCDDTKATRNPGKTEACDGLDNDCDGSIDEGVSKTYYQDFDKDGYGDSSSTIEACAAPAGYVTNDTDCDDSMASVYPDAVEICDGVDNNCDGLEDLGDTQVVQFDGHEDWVKMKDNSYLDIGYNDFTIEAWVRAFDVRNARVYSKGADFRGSVGYTVYTDTSGKLLSQIVAPAGQGIYCTSKTTVADNKWHHVAVTYDRDGLATIYIDAKVDKTCDVSSKKGQSVANGDSPVLGVSPYGYSEYSWKGQMDEIRVWSVVRTASDIKKYMCSYLNGDESGLMGYWPFVNDTLWDYTWHGSDGTFYGNAKFAER